MKTRTITAMSAALCFLGVGCFGDDTPDLPETVPVTGEVVYQGNPVGKAIITFIPTGSGKGGRALSNDDGTYTARTFFGASADREGLVPGTYKVTIFKDASDSDAPKQSAGTATVNERGETVFSGDYASGDTSAAAMIAKSALPDEYNSPQNTPLEITVVAGEPMVEFFDIP